MLISEQHALLVRFDTSATGSGTIDKANPADFSVSAIANNYSFGISGIDSSGSPMAIAGRFLSDGAGTFPVTILRFRMLNDRRDGDAADSRCTETFFRSTAEQDAARWSLSARFQAQAR